MSSHASCPRRAGVVAILTAALLALALSFHARPAAAHDYCTDDCSSDSWVDAGPLSGGAFPDGVPGLTNGPLSDGVFPDGVPGLQDGAFPDGVPGLTTGPLSEGVFPNGVPGLNRGTSAEVASDDWGDWGDAAPLY